MCFLEEESYVFILSKLAIAYPEVLVDLFFNSPTSLNREAHKWGGADEASLSFITSGKILRLKLMYFTLLYRHVGHKLQGGAHAIILDQPRDHVRFFSSSGIVANRDDKMIMIGLWILFYMNLCLIELMDNE